MKTIFRIKFVFTETNEKGKVVKKKMECLAECVNYTDAESLAIKISEREALQNVAYDIVKTKIDMGCILLNELVNPNDNLVNGLNELFFMGENDSFVLIKIKVFATPDCDKEMTEDYIIPASSNTNAIEYLAKVLLKNRVMNASDYMVMESKRDNAEMLFLTPSEYKRKINAQLSATHP